MLGERGEGLSQRPWRQEGKIGHDSMPSVVENKAV
jgi:hypothetical protein